MDAWNIQTYGLQKMESWGKFIATNIYIKKEERCQINNLKLYLQELEKEENKPQT